MTASHCAKRKAGCILHCVCFQTQFILPPSLWDLSAPQTNEFVLMVLSPFHTCGTEAQRDLPNVRARNFNSDLPGPTSMPQTQGHPFSAAANMMRSVSNENKPCFQAAISACQPGRKHRPRQQQAVCARTDLHAV